MEEPANHWFGQTAYDTGVLEPGGEHKEPASKLHLEGLGVSAPLSFSLLVWSKALCFTEEVKVQLGHTLRDTHRLAEELVVIRLVWSSKIDLHGGSRCVMLPSCLSPLVVSAVQRCRTWRRGFGCHPPRLRLKADSVCSCWAASRSSNATFWTKATCWANSNRRAIARFVLLLSGMNESRGREQTVPTK